MSKHVFVPRLLVDTIPERVIAVRGIQFSPCVRSVPELLALGASPQRMEVVVCFFVEGLMHPAPVPHIAVFVYTRDLFFDIFFDLCRQVNYIGRCDAITAEQDRLDDDFVL